MTPVLSSLLLLAPLFGAPPAGAGPAVPRVFAGFGGGVIDLRWVPDRDALPVGYRVYRAHQLLTDPPLRRQNDIAQLREKLGPLLPNLLELLRVPAGATELDDTIWELAIEREEVAGLVTLLAMTSPAVAEVLAERYVDTTVPEGQSVTYTVTMVLPSGREQSLGSATVVARPARPPAPRGVAVSARAGAVTVEWPVEQAAMARDAIVSYRVLRARRQSGPWLTAGGGAVLVAAAPGERPAPVFVDPDMPSATWWYRVVAVDVFGRQSEPSSPQKVVVADDVPPAVPVLESVVLGEAGFTVTWWPPVAADAASFRVERAVSRGGPWKALTHCGREPEARSCVDEGALGAAWYRVATVDAAGNVSAPSEPFPVYARDIDPPPAPQRVTAKADRRKPHLVTVSWSKVPGRDVGGYQVLERLGDPAAPPRVVAEVPARGRAQVRLEGRTSHHQAYHYSVRALDASGNIGPEGLAAALVDATVAAPARPALTGLASTADGPTLSWAIAPTPAPATFLVERAAGTSGEFDEVAELPGSARSWVDRSASAGSTVAYRVLALDATGKKVSEPSTAMALKPFVPPRDNPAPEGLSAQRTARGVALKWRGASGLEFRVYRATGEAAPAFLSATTGTAFVDADTDASAPRSYHVVRVDRRGDESAPSATVVVEPPPAPAADEGGPR